MAVVLGSYQLAPYYTRLMIIVCGFSLLYKSESESRSALALQHTVDQERKIHYTAELNAARTEGRLTFELDSGFSQLHHVLKNLLVGMQVATSSCHLLDIVASCAGLYLTLGL